MMSADTPAVTSAALTSPTTVATSMATSTAVTAPSAGSLSVNIGILPLPVMPLFAQLATIKLKRDDYLLWKSKVYPC